MHLRALFVLVLVDPYAGSTPSGRAFANYWNRDNVCEDSLLARRHGPRVHAGCVGISRLGPGRVLR